MSYAFSPSGFAENRKWWKKALFPYKINIDRKQIFA